MIYRQFDTGTWTDPWFEQLPIPAKLLFIYLWTNQLTNSAGFYEISLARIKFESGIDPEKFLPMLAPKIEWLPSISRIWVKRFFSRQCCNPKYAHGALREILKLSEGIARQWVEQNAEDLKRYGIDTVSIPYANRMDTVTIPFPSRACGTATVTETVTEEKNSSEPGEAPAHEPPVIVLPKAGKEKKHPVFQGDISHWQELYPGLRILAELRKMKAWFEANPTKRRVNVPRFIVNWLNKAQDASGRKPGAGQPPPHPMRKITCHFCQHTGETDKPPGEIVCSRCREPAYRRRDDGTYAERWPEPGGGAAALVGKLAQAKGG